MILQTRPKVRSRRFRAVLAGGLVLGLGAMVTLASWNDSEFATGTFAASSFNLEGSENGSTFTDHAAAPGAPLGFAVNPGNLAPDDVVYAGFAVRLAANTSRPATVTLTSAGSTGATTGLTYELIATTEFECSATTIGTTLIPAGTPIGTVPAGTTFGLSVATAPAPGVEQNMCFRVAADNGLVQNQSGTVTWQFAAASI